MDYFSESWSRFESSLYEAYGYYASTKLQAYPLDENLSLAADGSSC